MVRGRNGALRGLPRGLEFLAMAYNPTDMLSRLGHRLQFLRNSRGYTQEQVAERSGYSGKYVSEIERGRRDPPFSTLMRILENGMGCSFEDVVVVLSARRGEVVEPVARYDARYARPVEAIAHEIARLPTNESRRKALAVVRGVLALARQPERERK